MPPLGHRRFPAFKTGRPRQIAPPPETDPWFWNPNRIGVKGPPADFAAQLKNFDEDLAVTWNPIEERWYVWMRKPSLHARLCQGWMLLFPVRSEDGGYLPLDQRVFARLYAASTAKWGNGRRYFERIASEIERDRAKREADRTDAVGWMARDYWKHTQPQISMCGPSLGSKFANNT